MIKHDIIYANSREDGAEALERWYLVNPDKHIQYVLAWDLKDGTIKIDIAYKETKEQGNGLDNEFKQ